MGPLLLKDDIISNFTISNQTADFSLNKGFVITNDTFSLKLQNLLEETITVNIYFNLDSLQTSEETSSDDISFYDLFSEEDSTDEDIHGEIDDSFELKSGELKTINFGIGEIDKEQVVFMKLSSESTSYVIVHYQFKSPTIESYLTNNC